jgi:hypothetical protein
MKPGGATTGKNGTLEGEEFVLRDSRGRVRARLGCNERGPVFVLLDPSGNQRAGLGVVDANPHLCLYDREGKIRLHLSLDGESPTISLHDRFPYAPTYLEAGPRGAYFSLGAPSSSEAITLCAGSGHTGIDILWARGRGAGRSVRLGLGPTGPTLTLNAATGGPRIELSVKGQKPVVAFLNKRADRVLTLTLVGQKPILRLQGPKGLPARLIRLEDIKTWGQSPPAAGLTAKEQ